MITVEPNFNDRMQTPPAISFDDTSINELIGTLYDWERVWRASADDVVAATERLQQASQLHGYNQAVVEKLRAVTLDLIGSGPSRRLNGVLRRYTETALLNTPEPFPPRPGKREVST